MLVTDELQRTTAFQETLCGVGGGAQLPAGSQLRRGGSLSPISRQLNHSGTHQARAMGTRSHGP